MPDREFSMKNEEKNTHNYLKRKKDQNHVRSLILTYEQLRSARYLNRARAAHIKPTT